MTDRFRIISLGLILGMIRKCCHTGSMENVQDALSDSMHRYVLLTNLS